MSTAEKLLKLLERYSKRYIDRKVIYWEFEAVARRELGLSHNEFWDLIEQLEDEGKIELELSKNKVDVYFKPKECDGDGRT